MSHPPPMTPRLSCPVCGVEVTLSEDPSVMVAEVEAFSAAHSNHAEGVGVDSDGEADETA